MSPSSGSGGRSQAERGGFYRGTPGQLVPISALLGHLRVVRVFDGELKTLRAVSPAALLRVSGLSWPYPTFAAISHWGRLALLCSGRKAAVSSAGSVSLT